MHMDFANTRFHCSVRDSVGKVGHRAVVWTGISLPCFVFVGFGPQRTQGYENGSPFGARASSFAALRVLSTLWGEGASLHFSCLSCGVGQEVQSSGWGMGHWLCSWEAVVRRQRTQNIGCETSRHWSPGVIWVKYVHAEEVWRCGWLWAVQ